MKKITLALSITLLALPLAFNACESQSMRTPNGQVFGADDIIQSTGGGNPLVREMGVVLSPFQRHAIEDLMFCVSRLRFKPAGATSYRSNVRFTLGDIHLLATGTRLAGVIIPEGDYEEIEMELDDSCPSGKSVQLLRDGRSFSTSRFIEISFSGRFTAQQAKMQLTLGLQEIVKNLKSINSSDEIKGAIESAMEKYKTD